MSVMAEKLPSLMIERPKMPRATWDALRAHIVRERQRKKHKLEQSAEVKIFSFVKIKFWHIFSTFFRIWFFFSVRTSEKTRKRTQEKARGTITWGNKRTNYTTWEEFDQFQKRQAWIISHSEKSSIWGRYAKAIQGGPTPPSTSTLYAICNSASTR